MSDNGDWTSDNRAACCSDEMSGKLMGLGVDMVNEACARADRLCATIVVKDTMSCWNSETDSSRGR